MTTHRRNKYGGDFIRQLADLPVCCSALWRTMQIILANVVWLPVTLAVNNFLPSHGPGVNGVAIAFCCGTGSPVTSLHQTRLRHGLSCCVDRDAVAGSQAQRHAGLENFRERRMLSRPRA
ncbi:hypothetical protein MJ563_06820 [Klebsiella pneumoniae]|nr:hypothetical protein MJ563_06820 [Klebsiella pneumoniae]